MTNLLPLLVAAEVGLIVVVVFSLIGVVDFVEVLFAVVVVLEESMMLD